MADYGLFESGNGLSCVWLFTKFEPLGSVWVSLDSEGWKPGLRGFMGLTATAFATAFFC